jgi:hypothetical protein
MPFSPTWNSSVTFSMANDRVGDVLNAQVNLGEALKSYRDSLVIRERLAEANPA